MSFPSQLLDDARTLLDICRRKKLTLTTAESCTGGLISALLTEISGASEVFTHGFVTYANEAKRGMLGVDKKLLDSFGAVSGEVASAMAEGALKAAKASLALAVTGVAGPTGGTQAKPVGLVYIAVAAKHRATKSQMHHFTGDRSSIRMQSVEAALALLKTAL